MTAHARHADARRQGAAINRLNRALDCIDEAQAQLDRALQLLAALECRRREHQRLARLADRLSWAWIELRATANRLRRRDRTAHPAS